MIKNRSPRRAAAVLLAAGLSCSRAADESGATAGPTVTVPSATTTASGAAAAVKPPVPSAVASRDAAAEPPPACPADMLLVAGSYCPKVEHECLEHLKDYEQEEERRKRASKRGETPPPLKAIDRCLRFARPGRCLSPERQPLRFCMDRYEWPNKQGELPALLVTWREARQACTTVGKRLCTADEFNFACEGEELLPYSYGYERDPERCSIDKPYVRLERRLSPYDFCLKNPLCKAQLEKVDQRVPIGSTPRCTSPFGVLDLNGNVNEWVERPGESPPRRSGLKGGWWGPARSRCRPMVTSHDENYVGYEVGFRCCRDAPAGN